MTKKILFSKRVLYILCFMALNLIELLRASQTGDVWYVAVNCVGLVVMVMIASVCPLRQLCTPVNAVYTVLCGVAMAAAAVYWNGHRGEFLLWQIETAIVNIWWIGIAVKYLFQKTIVSGSVRFRPGVRGWLWIIMSMLMIASVSGRLWPVWFLLMFGSFYLTEYGPEERRVLWDGMIEGTILSFFCIQIYAYGFRPYDEVRYKGAFANCNMAALYYLIVYLMCLYKLHFLQMRKAGKGRKLFYLAGAGGMLSFQLYTMGRTAWMTAIVLTMLYGIFVVRKIWRKSWGRVFCRGGALVLATVLTFVPVYGTIRWFPAVLHHPVWYEGEYSVNKVHSFDPADSEKYVGLDEFLEALLGRLAGTLKRVGAQSPFAIKAYAAETEPQMPRVDLLEVPWTKDKGILNRLTIYKAYWDDLTWYGNGPDKGYYLIGTGKYHSWHAQNLWLQIAYYFGIPAGILLIVLSVVLLYHHGKKMLADWENPYGIIPFFVCVLFMVFGLSEVVWNPGQLVMFLIFFVQHPQLPDGKSGAGPSAELQVESRKDIFDSSAR